MDIREFEFLRLTLPEPFKERFGISFDEFKDEPVIEFVKGEDALLCSAQSIIKFELLHFDFQVAGNKKPTRGQMLYIETDALRATVDEDEINIRIKSEYLK